MLFISLLITQASAFDYTPRETYVWQANNGDAEAQYHLASIYASENDNNEALRWIRLSAEQGFDRAQYDLGMIYYEGGLVTQDYAEAEKWIRKAANQGYMRAFRPLGEMYKYGRGVNRDYAMAMKWYQLAADQGDSDANHDIGLLYEAGLGVERDFAEANKWYLFANPRRKATVTAFYQFNPDGSCSEIYRGGDYETPC